MDRLLAAVPATCAERAVVRPQRRTYHAMRAIKTVPTALNTSEIVQLAFSRSGQSLGSCVPSANLCLAMQPISPRPVAVVCVGPAASTDRG